MKKLLLALMCLFAFSACSKAPSHDQSSLVITSDSSVGIRALQGSNVVAGKIVIQNSGLNILKNLQLTVLDTPSDVSLTKGNCGNTLEAGESCYYIINYQPGVNTERQNTEQLITFSASAEDAHGGVSKDSYTMVMQSFVNADPALSQPMSFFPSGGFIEGFKKGGVDLLYANGEGPPNLSAKTILLRSTDGWRWSVVGANWNELNPSIQNVKAVNMDLNHHVLITYSSKQSAFAGIAQYDGIRWHTRSLEDLENSPRIQILLNAMKVKGEDLSFPSKAVLITTTGDLYVGLGWDRYDYTEEMAKETGNRGYSGILEFNGSQWKEFPIPVENLRQFDGVIYAATGDGVARLAGKEWRKIGKFDTRKWQSASSPTIEDVLQTPEGDLYVIDHYHGVLKYDVKADLWRPVGPAVEAWDGGGYSNLAFFNGTLYVDDPDGWLETYNSKANRWEKAQGLDKKDADELYSNNVPDDYGGVGSYTLFSVHGKFLYVLVNDYDAGLYRYDDNRWVTIKEWQ